MKNEEIVLKLISEGKTKSEIVREANISFETLRKWSNKNNIVVKSALHIITQDIIDNIILENKNGLTNKQISEKLHISPQTVRKYLGDIEYNSVKAKPLNKEKELVLTDEQKEILYGSLLGDMSIGMQCKEARFTISQGGNQEKYFDYKCSFFMDVLGKISKKDRYDKRTNKYYHKYSVRSKCHPYFTKLYNEFYKDGVKTVTREILEKLTPRSLAFWFMDDGNNNGILATNCFSYEECLLIQEVFLNKFDIQTSIGRQKNKGGIQYLTYIKTLSRKTFYNLVKDYIIPEMEYKFRGWS